MLTWLLLACLRAESPPPDALTAMRALPLVVTRHANCRMRCRGVDEADVAAVLAVGMLVPERSRDDGECPSHAVEGPARDGRPLRVVVAACADETRLVTAIDLSSSDDSDCDCP
jgi:hypothetical protein